MIQFNLLPDVKLEFIKAQRLKRMVTTVSVIVTAVALAVVSFLALSVYVVQRKHMNDITKDIATYSKDISATDDVNKILTVQNQLASLSGLHEQKQDTTRLFPFIQQLTPTDVSISSLEVDFDAQTMTITGAAESANAANKLASVNKFVDTLKFTTFTKDSDSESTQKAFSEVVLASFGRADKGASYSITLKFDPALFSNTEGVKLSVPSQITTRSETEKPNALFEVTTNSGAGN